MLGRKIGVRIAEQRFGSGNEFGIIVARAHSFAGVGRSGHGIDVKVVGEAGVRVVVEGRDFFDLRQQALVDSLQVGAGEGLSLGRGEDRAADRSSQQNEPPKGESHADSHSRSLWQR